MRGESKRFQSIKIKGAFDRENEADHDSQHLNFGSYLFMAKRPIKREHKENNSFDFGFENIKVNPKT